MADRSIKLLTPLDAPALEAFLARHADSSMFLRSNLRRAGLVDRGQPFQGTYVATIDDGEITAVAAHYWNGMLVLQAPVHLDALVREAVQRSSRKLAGLIGPREQVVAARRALGLEAAPTATAGEDGLYALDLAKLVVPPALASGRLRCRRSRPEELDLLTAWRVAFSVEVLGLTDGAALRRAARDDIVLAQREGVDWLLLDGDAPVAHSDFNASLPDIVQIGGVWTPPPLRNRGYGRAVVAGSLLAARDEGVRRAVLFSADAAAIRAYEAIGFRRVGEYGLVIFEEAVSYQRSAVSQDETRLADS